MTAYEFWQMEKYGNVLAENGTIEEPTKELPSFEMEIYYELEPDEKPVYIGSND